MKNILYITYYWPPSGGAGVQRSLKFIKYLGEFGIKPHVLTVDAEKASYPINDETLVKEIPFGIKVVSTDSFEPLRIFSAISSKNKIPHGGFSGTRKETIIQKLLKFIRGNFFIPDARRGWVKFAVKKAVEIMKQEKINLVMISSPPHSSQLIGLKLRKIIPHCKWIADLRDPWTDIYYYKDLMHTLPSKMLDMNYEQKVLENCDAAIVVSEDIKRLFATKSEKVDQNKISVIPNGFDETDFEFGIFPESSQFTLTYVGTISDNYDPEILFIAFRKVMADLPEIKMSLRFVGSISEKINQLILKYKLEEKVELISHVSHKSAIRYMQVASMLLLVIPVVDNDKGILTGKLFEYIGSGRPIIAIGPTDGDAALILDESKCGKMFNRDEMDSMQEYLLESVKLWKSNPSFNYTPSEGSEFSRRNLTSQLARLINNL